MSYPNFPNAARRARILEANQHRQQGLTLRQIGKTMGCAHSTVAGYLRDFELFRLDLMAELAADQIVTNAIQLADVESEHFDRRLAAVREYRLLLSALPEMRRDERVRAKELTNGFLQVDRYGNRYPVPNRMFPLTEEEQRQSLEPPARLPAGRPDPDVPLYCPPLPQPAPVETDAPVAIDETGPSEQVEQTDQSEQIRTESNKTEQESTPDPVQDGTSANSGQNSGQHAPDPSIQALQEAIKRVERELEIHCLPRDWLNDYPEHNPGHPARAKALRLVKKKEELEAQLAAAAA